jgi:enediyne biosynthesis protein E4
MDNDGDLDALNVVYVDKSSYTTDGYMDDRTKVYLNNGDGTFKPGPAYDFGPSMFEAFAGISFFDYDLDGILDMFAGRHYNDYGVLDSCEQDNLYKGLGGGKFKEMTKGSGVETQKVTDETLASGKNHKATWGVASCDVDGDGYTDIMTTTYGRSFNMFYRNKGDGSFEDLSISSNFASDGIEDYSDDQFFRCFCADAANKDTEYCKDAPSPSITCGSYSWTPGFSDQPHRLGGNSSGTLCADFDGDGDMDMFAIELAHWHIGSASDKSMLIMNDGFPQTPFRRVDEKESGITRARSGGWNDGDLGGLAADLDNDGKMDIYVLSSDYDGTKSLLFQQQSDGKFKETGKDAGAQIPRAHGGSLIDIDRDGDYDLIVGVSMMRWGTDAADYNKRPEKQWVTVLRNDTGSDANRVIINISGSKANRSAIGARIIVKADGKEFVREVQSSYGLTGFQNDSLQIIGLGNICEIEEIEVRWPDKDRTVTKYTEVYANYLLEIDQEKGLKHYTLEDYFSKE